MNTKTFLSIFNSIETIINHLVRTVVSIFTFAVTEIAPILAPLPPAFSIYTAMDQRLHTPLYISIVAAIAIEVVGMFSAKVSIRCYQWQNERNKTDPTIPRDLSIAMTSVFFAVVLLLSLTVELTPTLTALIIPGFVLIAISTYINVAIHTNLEKLELDKATALDQREEKNGLAAQVRAAKKDLTTLQNQAQILTQELQTLAAKRDALTAQIAAQKSAQKDANSVNAAFIPGNLAALDKARTTKQTQIEDRRSAVLQLLQQGKTPAEIAETTKVSPDTIRRDIAHLNGKAKIVT